MEHPITRILPAMCGDNRVRLEHSDRCFGKTADMALTTVLLDLDGVVRHFDPAHVASVEARHGLDDGALRTAAFENALIEQVITGRIPRSDWVREVGNRVGNPSAAVEWMSETGTVDDAMLGEVDALRSHSIRVAVLTNGTDTIPDEMESLGLVSHFDAIYNSAELGVAKPNPLVFEQVCSRLGVDPVEVFFTDDSASKLPGAIEIGMTVRLFEGVERFREHLAEAGFPSA